PVVHRDRSGRARRHRDLSRAGGDGGEDHARRPRGAPAGRAPLRRGGCGQEGHGSARRIARTDREAMYDVTVEFPKFKVGVATRDGVVTELKYLPLSFASVSSGNELAARAARQLEG